MNRDKLEKKIAELKSGNKRAFDYIYEHTNRSVYFAILYIVRDKMYAEDILQDTFIRAISALNQYQTGTNFSAWICKIGKSLALNHLKNIGGKFPRILKPIPINTVTTKQNFLIFSTLRQKFCPKKNITFLCYVRSQDINDGRCPRCSIFPSERLPGKTTRP